jgi:hypothetical protein
MFEMEQLSKVQRRSSPAASQRLLRKEAAVNEGKQK